MKIKFELYYKKGHLFRVSFPFFGYSNDLKSKAKICQILLAQFLVSVSNPTCPPWKSSGLVPRATVTYPYCTRHPCLHI